MVEATRSGHRLPAPPDGALDLHEGIGPVEVGAGCPRWPEKLRLLSTIGQLVHTMHNVRSDSSAIDSLSSHSND